MIGIFQGDAVSPLLLVIALIPLKHILRRANLGYEFQTGETNDLMMYSKSKGPGFFNQTVRIFSEDIGIQFGIDK